jgi:hypothetical protein
MSGFPFTGTLRTTKKILTPFHVIRVSNNLLIAASALYRKSVLPSMRIFTLPVYRLPSRLAVYVAKIKLAFPNGAPYLFNHFAAKVTNDLDFGYPAWVIGISHIFRMLFVKTSLAAKLADSPFYLPGRAQDRFATGKTGCLYFGTGFHFQALKSKAPDSCFAVYLPRLAARTNVHTNRALYP